jgi:hypothetical protein
MVNLGGLNLEDEVGGGKNWGECASGSTKPPILGEGRSNVAVLRCIAAGSSSTIEKNGGLLLELSGREVKTERYGATEQ